MDGMKEEEKLKSFLLGQDLEIVEHRRQLHMMELRKKHRFEQLNKRRNFFT